MSSASPSPADPAEAAGGLTRADVAEALRDVLLLPAEAAALEVHGRVDAAVLVPLYLAADGCLHAVFTRRRDDLRRHAGEISFPGGRNDPGEGLQATALREACEEVGLPVSAVEVIGALQPVPTIATDYAVYPFVGLIEPGFAWVPSAGEVAEVLELSLGDLRAGYGRRRLMRRGIPFRTDVYVVRAHAGGAGASEQLIWGATARMLTDLLDRLPERLSGAGPAPEPR